MGQYHVTVNLDKREFIHPHQLGDGLKLLEQASSEAGIGSALIALLAVSSDRGGGDFHVTEADKPDDVVGRWGGDRIAIVGDYAEDDDLPDKFHAAKIYDWCEPVPGEHKHDKDCPKGHPLYTNITPMVRDFLSRQLGVRYKGEGWLQKEWASGNPAKRGMSPDLVLTLGARPEPK